MAARIPKQKSKESMTWTKSGSERDIVSFVPGVNMMNGKGNLRPRLKVKKVKEVKAAVPVVQPDLTKEDEDETIDEADASCNLKAGFSDATSEVSQSILDTDGSTLTATYATGYKKPQTSDKVSLRDLCVEDKKRVANLIKELAKLGEEKESAEKNLEQERHRYEEQILKLCDQQEEILKEREEVQKRMYEYQTYIVKLKHKTQKEEAKLKQRTDQIAANAQTARHRPPAPEQHRGERNNLTSFVEGDQPSQHIYLNDLEDGDDEDGADEYQDHEDSSSGYFYTNRNNNIQNYPASGVENFSTQVQPSHSPQPSGREDLRSSTPGKVSRASGIHGNSPRPEDRPFTALIDKELENQKRALQVAMHSSKSNLEEKGSATAFGRDGKRIRQRSDRAGCNALETNDLNVARLSLGMNGDEAGFPMTPPPRPPPPKNVKASGAEERSMQGKENQRGRGSNLQNKVDDNRPTGNLALLTPEKNAILSRYMKGQSEMSHRDGQFCVEREIEEETYRYEVNSNNNKRNGCYHIDTVRYECVKDSKGNRFQHHQQINKISKEEDVEEREERLHHPQNYNTDLTPDDVKFHKQRKEIYDHSEKHQSNNNNNHKHRHHHHKKQRRPPPPSYGPLHPPVMSSTQKSSELADFVSVVSTEVSAPPGGAVHHFDKDNMASAQPLSSSPRDGHQPPGRKQNKGSGHCSKIKDRRVALSKSVEFTDEPGEPHKVKVYADDHDFLEKYRRMSPSERKHELLRQKSQLLEEQARLKSVLAEQEHQLQLKQQEAATKIEQYQDMKQSGVDGAERGELQQSLQRLEDELAKKERELIEGRELLVQKRQKHASLQAQTESASLESAQENGFGPKTSNTDTPQASTPKGSAAKDASSKIDEEDGEEMKLSGRDGDGCVLYPRSSDSSRQDSQGKIDEGRKKVDTGTDMQKGKSSENGEGDSTVSMMQKRCQVDAATSISYGKLPSVTTQTESTEEIHTDRTPRNVGGGRSTSSPSHSLSPGEKTLSVLEIINSLNDDILYPQTCRQSPRHPVTSHTSGFFSNSHSSFTSSGHPQFHQQRNNRKLILPEQYNFNMGHRLNPAVKEPEVVLSHKPGPFSVNIPGVKSLSSEKLGSFGVKLGGKGSFGKGNYSASQVISALANPVSGVGDGRDVLSRNRLAATFPLPLAGSHDRGRQFMPGFDQFGALSLQNEGLGRDENLDVFQLKRSKTIALNKHAVEHCDNFDDDDVINFLLKAKDGLDIDFSDHGSADLSKLGDGGDDSNLDELVAALEDQEREEVDHRMTSDEEEDLRRKTAYSSREHKSKPGQSLQRVQNDKHDNEEGLLEMMLRKLDNGDDNGSDNDEFNENIIDVDVDVLYDNIKENVEDDNEWEDMEDSQLLEDIFFVQ